MRLKPNIRGQLLLIVILLLLGFSVQFATNITAQNNLEYIQENQFNYLDRDAEVAEKLIRLLRDTQSVSNVRLQNLMLALLSEDLRLGQVLISVYRDRFAETLNLLQEREQEGYQLNTSQINTIPIFLQRNEEKINEIDEIIDTSDQSIYSRLGALQTDVNRVISNLIFSVDNLVEEYFLNTTIFNIAASKLLGNITLVENRITDLETEISSNPNNTYVSIIRSSIIRIQDSLLSFTSVLGAVERDWISTPPDLESRLNETLLVFDATGKQSLSKINTELSNLDAIIDTEPDQSTLNSIISAASTLEIHFNAIKETFNDLFTVYLQIKNYANSDLIQTMSQVTALTTRLIQDYDVEHAEFIVEYNNLQNSLRNEVQLITIGITAFLGFVIFVIIIPILFNMSGSIGRLRRDIRLLSDRKLYVKERKSYPDNELGQIESSFYRFADDLKDIVEVTQKSSSRLAGISEELAAGTEEASASINEVSQTINSISSGALQQRSMITSIRNQIGELQTEVREASRQINEASGFVQKVAQRTNILGLNASISAAKAGKFGKGFAIVAEEIRELSISTKESADEISELIDRVNFTIREMLNGIQSEVDIIMNVAETTADGSQQGNESTAEQVIMISEISQTSADLAGLAASLNEIMKGFDVKERR